MTSGLASAATIDVTRTDDVLANDATCSLREAVRAANANTASGAAAGECRAGSAGDTVRIPAGTFTLSIAGVDEDAAATGDLDVTSDLTISGAGAASSVVDAAGIDRVLHVVGAATGVEVSGLTLTGGHAPGAAPGADQVGADAAHSFDTPGTGTGGAAAGAGAGAGGGIRNDGSLALDAVVVRGNRAGNGGPGGAGTGGRGFSSPGAGGAGAPGTGGAGSAGGSGGGVFSAGPLTATDSTIVDNAAGAGGPGGAGQGGAGGDGGENVGGAGAPGTGGAGGAGGTGGGLAGPGAMTIVRSLVQANRAGPGGAGGGGTGGGGGSGGDSNQNTGWVGGAGGAGTGGLAGAGGAGGGLRALGAGVTATNTTFGLGSAGGGGAGGAGTGGSGGRGGTNAGPASSIGGTGGQGGDASGQDGAAPGDGAATAGGVSLTHGTVAANVAAAGGGTGATVPGTGGAGGGANHGSPGTAGADGTATPVSGPPSPPRGAVSDGDTLTRSVVAANALANCAGSVVDGGENVSFGDNTCPGLHADPKLGPLQDNGGPTPTMALGAGSAAIDAAASAGCPATDQRGFARPVGAGCDAGAFEVQPAPVVPGGGAGPGGGPGAPGPGGGGGGGLDPAPDLSAASLTARRFAVAPGATALTGRVAATRRGTAIRFTLSENARVRIVVQGSAAGRRVGGRCVAASRRNRARPACVRWLAAGALTRDAKAGRNRVGFTGRVGSRALRPGYYRLRLQATDGAGGRSPVRTLTFRIVAR
ncbi:MAG: hypothetical protein QOE65_2239 [Solirubrobacteraceae bacterium]|nr:hypothetical protein [Solirubrobacteraceae bacterium]